MERPPGLVSIHAMQNDSKRKDVHFAKRKQSLQARYVYGFIFFVTNLLAWLIRDYGHVVLTGLHHIVACGVKGDDCFHAGGVLRVSFGSSIYFLFMFLTTFKTSKLHDARNSWHSSWWISKLILYLAAMVIPFIVPTRFIQLYGEVARIGAGIFLLLQLVSAIHLITWCDSHWKPDLHSKQNGFLGILLSAIFYTVSFSWIALMYFKYVPNSSCTLNIFLIMCTVIFVNVMMIVSLHSKINRGLLSSALMGLYITFLCWSTIQSEPPIEKCNIKKEMDENIDLTTILSFLIAVCAIVMTTFSTGIDSESFQFRKDEAHSEEDIPYKYDVFHIIFSLGAMHFAMLFISWELHHSTTKWSIDVGWASTWVKIVNEWFAASLYLWKLISPVATWEKGSNQQESVQNSHGSV